MLQKKGLSLVFTEISVCHNLNRIPKCRQFSNCPVDLQSPKNSTHLIDSASPTKSQRLLDLPTDVKLFQSEVQSSHDLCTRIETVVCTQIRPLSINEILSLHTGPNDDNAVSPISSNSEMTEITTTDPKRTEERGQHSNTCRTEELSNESSSSVQKSHSVPPQNFPAILRYDRNWEVLLLRSANWARQEIPVRLAHRLHDFGRLPFVVVSNPHVFEVFHLYCRAFEYLMDFGEITTLEDEGRFTKQLRQTVSAHANVVALMQRGISTFQQAHNGICLDGFLDRLFGTRIGNRVLAETHLALHDNPEWFDHGTRIGDDA